jgi:predicted kinase
LILLNGPPACGKSTLARRYVEDHPLALNLDIDCVRSLIGGWRDDPLAAGMLARDIALSAARVHSASGHDVVVPQFLGRMAFIEQLERVAGDAGATFHEVVLLDSRENARRRFVERHRAASASSHAEAREIAWRLVSPEELSTMYDRLMSVIGARPDARVVHVEEGSVDQTYQALLASLG